MNLPNLHRSATPLAFFTLTALTGAVSLAAQEVAVAPAASPAEVRVLKTRTVPLSSGRNLTIQRVSRPVATPDSLQPVALPPPSSSLPLVFRAAPQETRLLFLNVTRYADNLSYLEWWPTGGGEPMAAWSNADFGALRMVPDVDVTVNAGAVRYSIFPFSIGAGRTAPVAGPVAFPTLPADGPGFLVVKGDPTDTTKTAPIAALHKIYKEQGAALKTAAEERDQQRTAEEAARASFPPQDVILNHSGIRKGGAR